MARSTHSGLTLGLGRGRNGSGRGVASFAALGAIFLLLAAPLAADDAVVKVLGTGSPTGTVTAASPHATAVGKWLQVTGQRRDDSYLTFQLSGGASATVVVQVSHDGTTVDTPYTFSASGVMYRIEACGGCVFRAVCTAFTSGSPVVTAAASGQAQVTVLP